MVEICSVVLLDVCKEEEEIGCPVDADEGMVNIELSADVVVSVTWAVEDKKLVVACVETKVVVNAALIGLDVVP